MQNNQDLVELIIKLQTDINEIDDENELLSLHIQDQDVQISNMLSIINAEMMGHQHIENSLEQE